MVDAEALTEAARTWWFEALGVLVALVLGVLALRAGDLPAILLGALAVVALVDRIRIRIDNRSLAAQLRRVRDRRSPDGE